MNIYLEYLSSTDSFSQLILNQRKKTDSPSISKQEFIDYQTDNFF